jgi:branched-chain amino acid aminotransferase
LIVEDKFHRATPGGTGSVKTIGNYASVILQSSLKPITYSFDAEVIVMAISATSLPDISISDVFDVIFLVQICKS